MAKIYLVMQDVPYDSCDPMIAFEDEQMAKDFAEERSQDRFIGVNWRYFVEELELVEKPNGSSSS